MFFVGIGREINGDNIVVTYYKNKLGGGATDVKPKLADVKGDTIGNGDPHIPNNDIIPQNTQNVNQNQIQGEPMNIIEQIKAEKRLGLATIAKITFTTNHSDERSVSHNAQLITSSNKIIPQNNLHITPIWIK